MKRVEIEEGWGRWCVTVMDGSILLEPPFTTTNEHLARSKKRELEAKYKVREDNVFTHHAGREARSGGIK